MTEAELAALEERARYCSSSWGEYAVKKLIEEVRRLHTVLDQATTPELETTP